jgi:acyl-coenzyme A synthetase/AMP-(fatty) acid ligase
MGQSMIEFPFANMNDALAHHARQKPDAPALSAGGERLNYAALADLVARAASYLTAIGLQPGERVGLGLANSIERVILGLAAMWHGAVPVELPPGLPATVLAARVQRFSLAASFVEANGPDSPARIGIKLGFNWRAGLAHHAPRPPAVLTPEQLQIIIPSSGSTGEPKGVVITQHQRIIRAGVYLTRFGDAWGLEPGPLLMLAPAATSLISQCLATQLVAGGPTVLFPPFQTVQDMARAIAGWDDAICPMPPGMIREFLSMGISGTHLFPRLRALITSGQPMAAHDKQAVMTRLTARLHEVYGSSGFGLMAYAGPAELAAKPGSVGRPAFGPGIEVQIVTPEREALPPGIPGTLRLRGPAAALGYINPEDNLHTEHFAEGWYYPGEIAMLDHTGYLTLQGRAADAIRINGRNLYPPAIEDALTRYQEIAEAAVVAQSRDEGGDDIAAFIVPRPGFRQEVFWAHCAATLAPESRPKTIFQLPALPRTGNGKLDRPALKQQAAQMAHQP